MSVKLITQYVEITLGFEIVFYIEIPSFGMKVNKTEDDSKRSHTPLHRLLVDILQRRHTIAEADLDLTLYKGQPLIKQTIHGSWLEWIKGVLY